MLKLIKSSTVKKLLPTRSATSHKGQNGRVLVVGGSMDYSGAPILTGLGALYSGVDLVTIMVPECNFECTRSFYPDFIVKKYPGEMLTERYAALVVEAAKNNDVVVMGPGLGHNEKTLAAVLEILKKLPVPTVLDADAIQALKMVEKFPLPQPIVITPHMNEFQNLVDREVNFSAKDPKSTILLRSVAMDLHINVLLKGRVDFVASEEGFIEINETGNAGMTVGGTGDVLAGLVASMLAQGLDPFDACKVAAFYNGKAGDLIFKKKGVNFSASDLAFTLPEALR